VNELNEVKSDIDFAHYRSVLKNQSIVDEIERSHKAFKPVTIDVSKQISAIEKFEATAMENAKQTETKVDAELKDLRKTLENIEQGKEARYGYG